MTAFARIPVAGYFSTVLPTMDFETFSFAGLRWNGKGWKAPHGVQEKNKGLSAVGARVYAMHPSTEVLTFSYDLKDGRGTRRWRPGLPLPLDLFSYLATGGLIEAHNAAFERVIWTFVCQRKYGWPALNPAQLRCSAAKCRAVGLPGSLEKAAEVLGTRAKNADGKALIKLLSMPQNPTKKQPKIRLLPEDVPEEFSRLEVYCDDDIAAESEISHAIPDLPPTELAYWQADQEINFRGIGIDLAAVKNCVAIVDAVMAKYGEEMRLLTGGLEPSQVQALLGWLSARGVTTKSLDDDHTTALLARTDLPSDARRVLELRSLCASASVKKVYAMLHHSTEAERVHDLFIYHRARTGRDGHADVQPGNLPKAGPRLRWCDSDGCHRPYGFARDFCPWCGAGAAFSRATPHADPKSDANKWHHLATEHALAVIATRSVEAVEFFFGDALLTVSGCVRGLFKAAEGSRFLCADYSSIEGVVTAVLAGEQWRIEAYERKEDLYLHGAAGVTGKTYEEYKAYQAQHGKHPDRQKIGKPAELGLGFGGWVSAWRVFDDTDTYTDKEVAALIQKWRNASPMIVELWGGQFRGTPWAPERLEYFGLEGMAILAVLNPGQRFTYRLISFEVIEDVLYMILPSGRRIAYRQPRLTRGARREGWVEQYELTYMTWNSNPKMGPLGWVRMGTHGGRLTENAVQAVARDIMAHAVVNLERAGYPVVLRIHDELAAELANGFGSLEEFCRIMADLPFWAKGWPIRCSGWEGPRFRKDD